MATAFLVIRTRLNNLADRQRFDDWYRTEQLPSSIETFEADRGWRAWSRTNPLVHIALYEFSSVEKAESILDSAALAARSGAFDSAWGTSTSRTREIVEVAE